MSSTQLVATAAAANLIAQANTRRPSSIPEQFYGVASFPVLTADSDRQDLVNWLVICDPNGCYSDACSVAEYGAPLTLSEAWQCVAAMCEQ